jgi:ribosomal protein S18 acetylase RimI-like enzyme
MGTAAIRLAQISEQAAVTACVRAAYGHYVERIGLRPAPLDADYATRIADGHVHVLLADGGVIAGVLVLQRADPVLWIENVAIHPRFQHQGLGRELLAFAEEQARVAGMGEMRLYTHELMVENIALYQRLGYAETERRQERGFRRVFMRKPLPQRRPRT